MTYDNMPPHSGWLTYRVGQGILLEQREVLLCGNCWYADKPLVWTLPGGRAGDGEGIQQAVEREFLEETGLTVEVGGLAYVVEARSEAARRLFLTCAFTVTRISGEVTCLGDKAVEEVKFVPIEELPLYLPGPSLGAPLRWHLGNPKSMVRYWFFPEYMSG